MLKRPFDILGSLVGLILLGLPLLLLALAIRLDSPGPAIFRQRRAGRGGRPFTMLKFRTMRTDADPYGDSPQSGRDTRLTRLGRFLRETSLDELPQLLNILAGQMSVVGPRPLYESQAERWNGRQRRRLEVRPGLTGYAQAYGRGSLSHEEKIELDVWYVEHRSFWLDLRIIFRTMANVVRRGDIYERPGTAAIRGCDRTAGIPACDASPATTESQAGMPELLAGTAAIPGCEEHGRDAHATHGQDARATGGGHAQA